MAPNTPRFHQITFHQLLIIKHPWGLPKKQFNTKRRVKHLMHHRCQTYLYFETLQSFFCSFLNTNQVEKCLNLFLTCFSSHFCPTLHKCYLYKWFCRGLFFFLGLHYVIILLLSPRHETQQPSDYRYKSHPAVSIRFTNTPSLSFPRSRRRVNYHSQSRDRLPI